MNSRAFARSISTAQLYVHTTLMSNHYATSSNYAQNKCHSIIYQGLDEGLLTDLPGKVLEILRASNATILAVCFSVLIKTLSHDLRHLQGIV